MNWRKQKIRKSIDIWPEMARGLCLPTGFRNVLSLFILLFVLVPQAGFAVTYYVGTTADQNDGGDCTNGSNTDCSLRDAVAAATASAGEDTAQVPAGTYILTLGQITSNNGKLNVVGAGSGTTTIDGNNASRIFDTGWTTAGMAFTDITLTQGNAGASADGGCVIMRNQNITVTNSVFSYCQARRGGAIFSDQTITVTVSGSTFNNNSAANTSVNGGGAIQSKGVTVTNSTFTSNTATNASARGGAIYSPTTVSVTGSTFTSNQLTTGGDGGAIYGLSTTTIDTSTFTTNSTASGKGGALHVNASTLTVTDSTFSSNTSTSDGGAINSIANVTVDGSTFDGNSTSGGLGGAIARYGTVTITNSTFSGNSSNSGGGAIRGGTTTSIKYSTFYNNSSNSGNSGGAVLADTLTTEGSIYTANTSNSVADHCGWSAKTSTGYNIDHGGYCGFTPTTGDVTTDPLLQALADNGGPTKTHAISSGPAVDGGPASCTAATGDVDQRNTVRPQNSNCDIGAYEYEVAAGPTNTFTSGTYNASTDTLIFTGTDFDTIDAVSTDVKTYMDWTKFSWDVNGDNATTTNISVAEADVTSLTVTNATTLTLVFTSAKATSIEGNADFRATGGADTLDITTGFSKDSVGTASTTDGVADAALSDITAPEAVSDLATGTTTSSSIQLTWTAPGNDADVLTASSYDVRYSTSNITNDTDFNNASQATGESSPSVAGTGESFTVTGLSAGTPYYFAIKTTDDSSNTSTLSNVPTASTDAGSSTLTLHPSGNASNPGGYSVTGTWAADLDSNDGDTSYASRCCTGPTVKFWVDMDDPTGLGGATINSITFHAYVRNTSSSHSADIGYMTDGATTVWKGSTVVASGASYTLLSSTSYTTDSAGGALDLADLNNLQIAVDRIGTGPSAMRVTEVYAVIDYTPASNTAPIGGYTANNVIPAAQVTQGANGIITINFRAQDAETEGVTLNTFEYSVNGGAGWSAPASGDASTSLSTNWEDNGSSYSSATDWTGTVHSFTFDTDHADVTGMAGVNQSDIQIRFTLNDGTDDSAAPVTSEDFQVNNTPTYYVGNIGTGTVTTGCFTSGNTTCTLPGALSLVSADGDTVRVEQAGTYAVKIVIDGDTGQTADANYNITLISDVGATAILAGDGANTPVLTITDTNITSSTVIDGFTINNSYDGGSASRGIYINSYAAPTLQNLILKGNQTTSSGGAIYISGATATVQNSTIGLTADKNQASYGAGIYAYYLSAALTIDNVDFDDNYATSTSYGGGAIHLYYNNSYGTTISNSTFTSNDGLDGGAIAIRSSSQTTTITNSDFSSNVATDEGGALYAFNYSPVDITGGTWNGNTAADIGGAIYIYDSSTSGSTLTITGGSYTNNVATDERGGAIYAQNITDLDISGATITGNTSNGTSGYGGGLYMAGFRPGASITISDSTIDSNSTYRSGGGLYLNANGGNISLTVSNTTFDSNATTYAYYSSYGGGISLSGINSIDFSMTGGSINGNTAKGSGGGLYRAGSGSNILDGVTINSNSSDEYGGGAYIGSSGTTTITDSYIQGNSSIKSGGGLRLTSTTATLTNCLVTGNRHTSASYWGGGIHNAGPLYLHNSTIAGNYSHGTGGGLYAGGTETLRNTLIYGNTDAGSGDEYSGSIDTEVTSLIDGTNPLFADLQQANSSTATTAGNYQLCYTTNDPVSGCGASSSPGMDTGGSLNAPGTDIVGTSRYQDIAGLGDGVADYDMGVYEYVGGGASDTIGGTVYSDKGTTKVGSGVPVRLLINGGSAQTTTTDANGAYSFETTIAATNIITVHIDGGSYVGATVTETDGNSINTMDIYDDTLITKFDNGSGSLTIADLNTGNDGDTELNAVYVVTAGELDVDGTGMTLYVWSGDEFAPGNNIYANHVDINGTLTASTNQIDVIGNWDASGGTFSSSGLVYFTNTSGSFTITPASSSNFYNIEVAGSGTGATWTLQDDTGADNNATFSYGTLDTHSTSNYDLTVGNDLVFSGSGNLNANTSTINVAGNWTMGGSATFTKGTSTVKLNGLGADQTITSGGQSFYNLTLFNESAFGSDDIHLADNLDVDGTLQLYDGDFNPASYTVYVGVDWDIVFGSFTRGTSTIVFDTNTAHNIDGSMSLYFYNLSATDSTNDSTDITLTFDDLDTIRIYGTITLDGLDGDDRINLVSDNPGSQWSLDLEPAAIKVIDYVDVQDSDASLSDATHKPITPTNGVDSGNNVDWFPVITISGIVYSDEGTTAITSPAKTVRLYVDGVAQGTDETDGTGEYSFSATAEAGSTILVYLEGETEDGAAVTVSSGSNITDLAIYQDRLIVRHDNGGNMTNALLDTADSGSPAAEMLFSAPGGALTVTAATELFIPASHTFVPGNSIGTIGMDINGTLTAGSNTITVFGDWDMTGGTFNEDTSSVTFAGTGTQSITSGGNAFNNLTVTNGSANAVSFVDAMSTTNFTATTADSVLKFQQSTTHTVSGTLDINGGSATNEVIITSVDGTTQFDLDVTGSAQAISYADVSDSTASTNDITCTNCINSSNNDDAGSSPQWVFIGPSYTVTKTADTDDGSCDVGDCSLREAIKAANDFAGLNQINIPAGTYTITLNGTDDTNALGDFDITDDVNIVGAGSGSTIIQEGTDLASAVDRIFHVTNSSAVTIEAVKVQFGKVTTDGGCINATSDITINDSIIDSCSSTANSRYGGAIYSGGAVTMDSSTVSNSSAAHYGGAMSSYGGTLTDVTFTNNNVLYAHGGAIYNRDNLLTINGSANTFTSNYAPATSTDYGGTIYSTGSLTISNATFTGRSGTNDAGRGGAIYLLDTTDVLTLSDSSFTDFGATNSGGAIRMNGGTLTNVTFTDNQAEVSHGGAIENFDNLLTITGTNTFDGNRAGAASNDYGGSIYSTGSLTISNTTFIGRNDTIVDAGRGGAIYLLDTTDVLTLSDSSFSNLLVANSGGAIRMYGGTMSNVTFTDNQAQLSVGGAIENFTNSLTITGTNTFTNNAAGTGTGDYGGMIYTTGALELSGATASGNSADAGGAIYIGAGVALTITDSSFDANEGLRLGGAINSGSGGATISSSTFSNNFTSGGAHDGGAIYSTGVLNVTNSTFSANTVGDQGGAIYQSTDATIKNSTFYNNSAVGSGEAIYRSAGTVTVENTIIAKSTASTSLCVNVTSNDYNLQYNGTCFTAQTNDLSADPLLNALADNGGLTKTHSLQAGSPAIDTANTATCAAAPVNNLDQRGGTRPINGGISLDCDMGSYENGFSVNSYPFGGYTEDNVIPVAQISQSNNGDGILTINWKVRDSNADSITLNTFEYSVNGGASWNAPTNADASASLSANWDDNGGGGFTSASTFGAATAHNFTFNTKHADVTGLTGIDQSDVRIRFTLNDGTVDSLLPATSENFQVDNVAPTDTITSSSYSSGADTLIITGTNFTTIAAASTDIKSYVDWSKFVWDINGDNATTANVTFVVGDITSLTVTDATTLTLVLTGAKGTALEGTAGYGATGGADTLDVTAGFSKDVAGNAATTDGIADAAITLGVAISGTVYTDEGTTTIADGATVRLIVNGSSVGTDTTSSGAYSINASVSAGDVMIAYIDGHASDGTTVTVSDSNALAGLNIYQDRLIVRHDNAGSLTNANLTTGLGAYSDAEILCTTDGSDNLTVTAGKELFIWTGDTFAPGAIVNADDVDINGTFTASTFAINVSGSWDNDAAAVFTSTGTTTFTSVDTGETITSNGDAFGAVVFDSGDATGGWTLQDAFTASSITVTDGTLIDNGQTVTVNGDMLIANTTGILTSTGTWIQGANGDIQNPFWHDNKFYILKIADGVTSNRIDDVTTQKVILGTGADITDAGGTYFKLTGISNDFIDQLGTSDIEGFLYVYPPDGVTTTQKALDLASPLLYFGYSTNGTVQMTDHWSVPRVYIHGGASSVDDATSAKLDTNGYNLTTTSTSGGISLGYAATGAYRGKILFSTGTHTINGRMSVDADSWGYFDLGSANITIGRDIDFFESTVTPGTSTVTLYGRDAVDASQTITSAGQSFHHLVIENDNAEDANDNIVLADALDVNGNLTITDGELQTGANAITLAGNWTNSIGNLGLTGTGTVTLDADTNHSFTGSTAFNNLSVSNSTSNATDVVLTFDNTATQTVGGTFTLDGLDADNRINLVSDSPGTQWNLDLTGAKGTLEFLDVTDSNASGSTVAKPIAPTSSVDGGNNADWFAGGSPTITVTKMSLVISDPINGGSSPKRIPGAVIEYMISPSNSGDASPDANSVFSTDPIDITSVEFYVTGSVSFTDGTTSSALALGAVTYSSTASPGPYVYDYTPVPDGDGYDSNITSVKVTTTGTFAFGGTPDPSFTLKYRVRVK